MLVPLCFASHLSPQSCCNTQCALLWGWPNLSLFTLVKSCCSTRHHTSVWHQGSAILLPVLHMQSLSAEFHPNMGSNFVLFPPCSLTLCTRLLQSHLQALEISLCIYPQGSTPYPHWRQEEALANTCRKRQHPFLLLSNTGRSVPCWGNLGPS